MIRIALFADIHGKFLLPFKLAAHYQQQTGKALDLLLQCGDTGAFPDIKNMDKATLRHAQKDRDELGFHDDFVEAKADIARFLDTLDLEMWCVRGNHEDHAFLDRLEQEAAAQDEALFAIDAYGKVKMCRSAVPFVFAKNGTRIRFVGIGRIGDRKGRTHPQFIQPYEQQAIRRLIRSRSEADILISHDKAGDSQRGYGADELVELLDQVAFAYHFYGHTGEAFQEALADNGITRSVKIKELEFNAQGTLEEGCMLILETETQGRETVFTLEAVPVAMLAEFTRHTWRYL